MQALSENTSTLLAIVLGSLFLIAVMVVVIIRQGRQIHELKVAAKPKYGFLGKPLMSLVALVLTVGGFGLTYYASQNAQNVVVNADKKVNLKIESRVSNPSTAGYRVELKVLPSIEGKDWGGSATEKFDAFWTVTGPTNVNEVEIGLSVTNTGGFVRTLPAGQYTVKVDVIYAKRSWNETIQLTVP